MAYTKSIAEIIEEAGNLGSKQEKIDFLRANESKALKNILILTYDKTKEFYLPDTPPPYKPSDYPDSQGMIYHDSTQRKLKYIVKGFSSPDIKQIKRETIFIELLESVDKGDAEVLCHMLTQKPFKGLRFSTVNEALNGVMKDGTEEVS